MFVERKGFRKLQEFMITQSSVNIYNAGMKLQVERLLTQIHVVLSVEDVMKDKESEKSLCLEKQPVPVTK